MRSNPARFLTAACALFICMLQAAVVAAGEPEKNPPPLTPKQIESIRAQITRLNAADNIEREDAEKQLLAFGQPALPLLKEALKAPEPETVARAKRLIGKLSEVAGRPTASYAEVLPSNTVFFLEAPHTRQTLDKMKESPLGKFWDLPAMQKFYTGHREMQVPNDQKILDAVRELPKLLDGKALFALGDPDTAEAAELDPPLLYVFESKQPDAFEAAVRKLFEGQTDPPKATRRYGPFNIEEHITAQTVFGQESIIHSLTQKGIETFLDSLLKRPEKPLHSELNEVRALLPKHDFVYRISADNFKDLADNGQLIDDQQLEVLETMGFVQGSSWAGVLSITPDGVEDAFRLKIGGGEKNEGLVAVLSRMAAAMPPPPADAAPKSLDLIPWQAGLLVSFNGDTAKNAAALSRALKSLDVIFAVPPPAPAAPAKVAPPPGPILQPKPGPQQGAQPIKPGPPPVLPNDPTKQPAPAPNAPKAPAPNAPKAPAPEPGARAVPDPLKPAPAEAQATPKLPAPGPDAPKDPVAAPVPKPAANTPGQQALAAGGGPKPGPAPAPAVIKPGPESKPGDEKPEKPKARGERQPPHIARFEKLGLKLEQFLEQVDGPVQLGLFLQQIEDDTPDDIPISPLLAVLLKDPKIIEQSLEAAAAGPTPRFTKEVLNGGVHYVEKDGNPETHPGFWLKGNYLAWSTERDLLDLAGAALLHQAGNERMADRATYKASVAAKRLDPSALFTIFGDAEQVLEMPYKLAKVRWQEDDANPWPDFELMRPLLKDKPVLLEFKSTPGGLQAHAISPLSLMGMIEAFRRPLIEAGFW